MPSVTRNVTPHVTGETRSGVPLKSLEEWDDFVARRYRPGKSHREFRNYQADAPPVTEFDRQHHARQTPGLVLARKKRFGGLKRENKSVWEMAAFLETLVDDSDPERDLTPIERLLQSSEAIRRDGHLRWFVPAGFHHDLGRVLCLWGEPQWAAVGDRFPVGCAYSDQIVFPGFFAGNADSRVSECQTVCGIYEPRGGLGEVHLCRGHDEYICLVARDYLPAQYIVRFYSFHPAHKHGAYRHLISLRDEEMFEWVRKFNPYDFYSQCAERPRFSELRPCDENLVSEFLPDQLAW